MKPTSQFPGPRHAHDSDLAGAAQQALRGLPGWAAPASLPAGRQRGARLSRRELLRVGVLTAGMLTAGELLAACGADNSQGGAAGGPGQPGPAGSVRALTANLPQLQLLNAQSQLPVDHSRFTFGISAEDNRLVEGLTPQVWLALDQTSKALGPFQAQWRKLNAYQQTHDRSPRSALNGFYVAAIDLPKPGRWLAVAILEAAAQRSAAQGAIPVGRQVPAQVGTKARPAPTPVATSHSVAAKICTRRPPCPLHDVSFDQALKSGRPTVLSLATPLLCTSRMCGPVVDELMVAAQRLGTAKVNFLHVEIYPQRDTSKPAPLYVEWGLKSEPWTVVIDPDGFIRARAEGPIVADEIQDALKPML